MRAKREAAPREPTGPIKVGLIGLGTIGTGVVKLLRRNQRTIDDKVGRRLQLVRIADLDPTRGRGLRLPAGMLVRDARRIVSDPEIDIVIELIGGLEPARSLVRTAIESGKSVVTANKAMLAVHGKELFHQARKFGVDVGFEASVAGGIPIIRVLREGLAADRNLSLYGIVNGTSNYILSRMQTEGREFGEVLAEAQKHGLAEADPSYDVDGVDAAHKLALLARLAFGAEVPLERVPAEGIRGLSQTDLSFAAELGYTVKLLAIAKNADEEIEVRVHPTMIPKHHVIASVSGAYNAIYLQSEALGSSMYFGLGAGMMPTATAVVADVIEAARAIIKGCQGRVPALGFPDSKRLRIKPLGELRSEYYLRIMAMDRPGVLAEISSILGRNDISIATVLQKGRKIGGAVPVIIRTHEALERDLNRAVRAITGLKSVRGRIVRMRIEDNLG